MSGVASFFFFLLVFLMFCGTLVFYCWAAVNLPGSAQEFMFEGNANRALEQHRRASNNATPESNKDDDGNN